MNLNCHGHSFNIQCDISILLKGIKNCKSRVVATLASPHHMWHKQQAYKWQLDQWRDDKDKRPSPPQLSAAASLTATDVRSPNLEDIPEDEAPEEESTSPIIADEDLETLDIPGTLQDP